MDFTRRAFIAGLMASAVAPAGATSMSRLVTVGDSLTVGYGVPAANCWANMLAAALPRTRLDFAQLNAMAGDMGRVLDGFIPLADDIATVDVGVNDQRWYGVNASKLSAFYVPQLREVLLAVSAPDRKFSRSGAVTFTGAWTDIPSAVNNTGRYTTTPGAKAVATVSGNAVYIGFLLTESSAANSSASVVIDGVAQAPIDATAWGVTTTLNWNCPPAAVRYGGLSSGSHTVEVTVTGPAGKYFYLNHITGSAQPSRPRVMVSNIARWSAAGYASFSPAFGGSDTNIASYNAAVAGVLADLVADGFNISTLDIHALIDPATDLQSDGAHWSVGGHNKVYGAELAAINGGYTFTSASVFKRSDGAFFAGVSSPEKQISVLP